ncbi:MAG TPA: hybrid sensor histidine kinase/response regulator, partial [Syntrophobacteraceae bacterium]|nr:hybrid sensor histidine kinase/response regulator [Syntrophobacteraceae bacterium]
DVVLDPETSASLGDIEPGTYVRLMVSDSGHGMAPEVLERVFEPYFTTKKQGEGTGMGLAVVHGIVKRHRGAIAIHSEPDKGTIVEIYLPRIDAPTAPLEEGRIPYPRGHEHILFVDDESSLVAMAQHMLERLGYQVTVQTSSLGALEAFRSHPQDFDLIITDLTMPNMTGLDLTREILKERPEIPVIMCTGFSELLTPEDAKAIGIRELIMKPIHTRQIAQTIRRLLDQTNQLA